MVCRAYPSWPLHPLMEVRPQRLPTYASSQVTARDEVSPLLELRPCPRETLRLPVSDCSAHCRLITCIQQDRRPVWTSAGSEGPLPWIVEVCRFRLL